MCVHEREREKVTERGKQNECMRQNEREKGEGERHTGKNERRTDRQRQKERGTEMEKNVRDGDRHRERAIARGKERE